ncbi:MAG: SusC/RagA family TonB-linked outer membrane protein [Bacteroidales bacterium]|nr:SusC/RagA family TonB-linked outer membrane protein [Bacteroidales bacterium]
MKYMRIVIMLMMAAFAFSMQAQEAALQGKVYDAATGQAIAGASVSMPGVASDYSDNDGRFQLKKTAANAVIQVKAQGYASRTLAYLGQTQLEIALYEEGYINAEQNIAMPFDDIRSDQMAHAYYAYDASGFQKRGAVSVEELMVGGSGVNAVARSGAAGSGVNMYLRGFNSLNANTQPLIVINGMPVDNRAYGTSLLEGNVSTPLSYIDAKDVESITVLKDGTALYGSRAANGVILINTLKPDQMVTRINVYTYAGLNFEPAKQYDMMDARQYRSYLSEIMQNSGEYSQEEMQALPYFDAQKPYMEAWGWEGNTDYYRYNQETDWQDMVFNNSLNQNYYINIKGGDDVATFALSLGFLKHNGVVTGTDFSRYTASFNSRINMGKRLTLFSNMAFSYGEKNMKDEGLSATSPVNIALSKAPFMTSYVYGADNLKTKDLEEADVLGVSNPYSAINNIEAAAKNYRFEANLRPQITLNKNLSLNAVFGLTTNKTTERTFYPMAGMSYEDHRLGAVHNKMSRRSLRFLQLYTDAYARYQWEERNEHRLVATVGARYQSSDVEEDLAFGFNSPTDDMKSIGSGDADYEINGGMLNNWRWLSMYAHADYSLKNRYLFAASLSLDGSSNYGKDAAGLLKVLNTPMAPFASLSAAWLISSEEWMPELSWLNQWKVRAALGTSGNDAVSTSYQVYKFYQPASFLGLYGMVRGNIPNTQLQWETSVKKNVGMDLALLNNRLNINFDLYDNNTNNLLCVKTLPSSAGITSYLTNDGKLNNRGFEVGVQGRLLNGPLKWDMALQVSHYKNTLLEYADQRSVASYAGANILTEEGQPLALFYGYETAPEVVFASQADADAANLQTEKSNGQYAAFGAGDVHFINQTQGDNVIDSEDMVVIGDPNPDLFGSLSTRLQWKRFSLNAMFNYSWGNDVYNALRHQMEAMSSTINQTAAALNRWSYEGHATTMPRAVYGDPMGNSRFSDRWIEDGSFFKLKTMTLAYQVPIKEGFPILRGLEVYATANNVFTLTNYLGYDPESNMSQNPLYYGIDTGATPQAASVLFGLRIAL